MASRQGNAHPDRKREVHAEDHQGAADGGGGQAAPRAGGHRSRAPLRPAHGGGHRQSGGRRFRPVRAAAAGRHRLATSAIWSSWRPPTAAWPAASTASIVRAAREKIAAPDRRGQGRQDHHHRPQGPRPAAPPAMATAIVESYRSRHQGPRPSRWCSPSPRRCSSLYRDGEFDVVTLIYSRFKSVVTQIPTVKQLIPAEVEAARRRT